MNKWYLFLVSFFFSASAWAGTVNLINDSPYTLRSVIYAADGTILGEMVLNPEHSIRWTDTYGQTGYFGSGSVKEERTERSQTPYEVHWECMNGDDFSISSQVSTGGGRLLLERGKDGEAVPLQTRKKNRGFQ